MEQKKGKDQLTTILGPRSFASHSHVPHINTGKIGTNGKNIEKVPSGVWVRECTAASG
jgi:hypothetical protein